MLSWKALLVALPLALAGGGAVAWAQARLAAVRLEMDRLEEAGRHEGASFMKTLEGAHADRQLAAFDRRRELALDLARARRDQLLGLLGLAAAALAYLAVALAGRIGEEIGAERARQEDGPRKP